MRSTLYSTLYPRHISGYTDSTSTNLGLGIGFGVRLRGWVFMVRVRKGVIEVDSENHISKRLLSNPKYS